MHHEVTDADVKERKVAGYSRASGRETQKNALALMLRGP